MNISMTSKSRLKGACERLCRISKDIPKDHSLQTVKSREIYHGVIAVVNAGLVNISIYGNTDQRSLKGTFTVGGLEDYLYPIFTISDEHDKVLLKTWVDKDGRAHFVAMGGDYTATMPLATPDDVCAWIIDYLWNI